MIPPPTATVASLDKGPSLERWVPINVFFSVCGTLLFVSFGTKSIFDREVPGIRTAGWVVFAAIECAIDGLLFFFMVLLMARSCRKEIKRNNQWYAYTDSWYDTYTTLATIAFGLSAWTLCGIVLYSNSYGGEDPYTWPSAYAIEKWDKPQVWRDLMGLSTMARIMLLLGHYYKVYRAVASPDLVPTRLDKVA